MFRTFVFTLRLPALELIDDYEPLLKWSERAVLKTPSPVVVSTDVAAVRWSTEGGGMPFIKNCTVSRIVVINHWSFQMFLVFWCHPCHRH